VTLDADGTIHLLSLERKSSEGGPISWDTIYASLAGGEVATRAPGPLSDMGLPQVLVDGQGQVLAQADNHDMENNLVWLDGQTWRPVEIPADLGLSEGDRRSIQRLLDQGLGWIGDDGIARFVDFPDPYPTAGDEWHAEVATGQVIAVRRVASSLGSPRRLIDVDAPGGPRGLFGDGLDNDELIAARLVCDTDACTWETDPEIRLIPPEPVSLSTRLVHTAGGVPVLIQTLLQPDGQPATGLYWPAGQVLLPGAVMLQRAVRRPSAGIAVASYRGHDTRLVDLWLVDEDFEVTQVTLDPDVDVGDLALTAHQAADQPERIQLLWTQGMRVHCIEIAPATGEQTKWDVSL
jgi:hypothetical protein